MYPLPKLPERELLKVVNTENIPNNTQLEHMDKSELITLIKNMKDDTKVLDMERTFAVSFAFQCKNQCQKRLNDVIETK